MTSDRGENCVVSSLSWCAGPSSIWGSPRSSRRSGGTPWWASSWPGTRWAVKSGTSRHSLWCWSSSSWISNPVIGETLRKTLTGQLIYDKFSLITRSDGMKCAMMKGPAEVRSCDEHQEARRVSITITNEDFQRKPVSVSSRDSSCPPSSGWRERLLLDQDEERKQKEEKIKQRELLAQQEREKADKPSKAIENKERKIRRVRKTSERRTRLDTINSESDFSVGILSSVLFLFFTLKLSFVRFLKLPTNLPGEKRKKREE